MSQTQQALAQVTGRYSSSRRHHPDQDHTDLYREVSVARIAAHVEKILADAPPLTEDQVQRLATVIRNGGGVA